MASSFVISAASIIVLLMFISAAAPAASARLVFDADGDGVRNGGRYYIVPPNASSGGLSWTPNNSSSPCPLFVNSKQDSDSLGTPVRISHLVRLPFIQTSRRVMLSFLDTNAPCSAGLGWSVSSGGEANDDDGNQLYITAGPSGSSVGLGRHFEIKRANRARRFFISLCSSNQQPSVVCFNLGFLENGLLGVNPKKPVPFRFVKAFSGNRRVTV